MWGKEKFRGSARFRIGGIVHGENHDFEHEENRKCWVHSNLCWCLTKVGQWHFEIKGNLEAVTSEEAERKLERITRKTKGWRSSNIRPAGRSGRWTS